MHIAQIFSHGGINGVTTAGVSLIRGLLARGHRITLVTRPGAWIAAQDWPSEVTITECEMGVKLLNYSAARALYNELTAQQVDLIHTHGSMADRLGALYFQFGKIPNLATAHARIAHLHWLFHNRVIAPSHYTADWYHRTFLARRRRVDIIPNFLEADSITPATATQSQTARAELGLPTDAYVIGMIGSINARKNQPAAAPILAALVQKNINAHLLVIGEGDTSSVIDRATSYDVGPRVHLLGHRPDARALLASMDAMLSTSHDEQASIVLLEGLAAGLPLFFTNVGSAPEIIENGVNGWVFDLSDTGPATAFMQKLSTDSAARSAVAQANRRKFETAYATDAVIPLFEKTYRKVLSGLSERPTQ